MPRTGSIRRPRRSHLSHSDSTSAHHRHKSDNIKPTSKIPHRFVRIRHKTESQTSVPHSTRNQAQITQIFTTHIPQPANPKRKVLLAKSGHSPGGEITSVPNPVPDTGFRSLPAPNVSASNQPMHSVPLSKTGLPMSLPSSSVVDSLSQAPFTPTSIPSATPDGNADPPVASNAAEMRPNQATQQPHKLSIPLIVLLAVGCALLVIGTFSLAKYYLRPTRRPRPRPSLPIPDDPFADDKEFPLEDSPVFGGKERMSNEIWSWAHAPQPGFEVTKPPSIAQPGAATQVTYGSPRQQRPSSTSGPKWRTQSSFLGHGHTQSVPTVTSGNSPFQASLQQLQGALSRAATRLSSTSTSLYPSSPQNGNVGLAITRSPMTAYTADGSSILKRNEPKVILDRSTSRAGVDSVTETTNLGSAPLNARNSEGSSYSEPDAGSPSFLPYTAPLRTPPAKPAGRSRIKSSYYNPNSYPRISGANLASNNNAQRSGPERQSSLRKSDARRDHDTQVLTHALGLTSPVSGYAPSSPQPTLYPDDSLSVIEAKLPHKPQTAHKKQAADKSKQDDKHSSFPVIATAMDASAALGSLMLMDFTGHATRVDDSSNKRMSKTGLSKAAAGAGANVSSSSSSTPGKGITPLKKSPSSRSNDKPPSIPLPELLPSLEQMGLEHSNPQAFADYRSPTYSIYGLYGSDRKSGTGY